jgi:hypothetical protein
VTEEIAWEDNYGFWRSHKAHLNVPVSSPATHWAEVLAIPDDEAVLDSAFGGIGGFADDGTFPGHKHLYLQRGSFGFSYGANDITRAHFKLGIMTYGDYPAPPLQLWYGTQEQYALAPSGQVGPWWFTPLRSAASPILEFGSCPDGAVIEFDLLSVGDINTPPTEWGTRLVLKLVDETPMPPVSGDPTQACQPWTWAYLTLYRGGTVVPSGPFGVLPLTGKGGRTRTGVGRGKGARV